MSNPFVQKAQERRERAQRTMTKHVRELEKILARLDPKDPTYERIAARLEEAQELARKEY